MANLEMRQSFLSGLMRGVAASPRLRRRVLGLALRLEGGEFFSRTARCIMRDRHGVVIGDYSYGACFDPESFPPGVTVGRYVSIAAGVLVYLRNHPMDRLSTHPFFFNKALGLLAEDNITTSALEIGHDAWIGSRAIIVSGCRRIGIGAVVGAGSVVTRDVPDFGIVAGAPARLIRHRFAEAERQALLSSRWWEKPAAELAALLPHMTRPVGPEVLRALAARP